MTASRQHVAAPDAAPPFPGIGPGCPAVRQCLSWSVGVAQSAEKRRVQAKFERQLMKGPWVLGEQHTICGASLLTIESRIEGARVDTTRLPRVTKQRKRMPAPPAVQKAAAAHALAAIGVFLGAVCIN
jgi:glutathione S-transferase